MSKIYDTCANDTLVLIMSLWDTTSSKVTGLYFSTLLHSSSSGLMDIYAMNIHTMADCRCRMEGRVLQLCFFLWRSQMGNRHPWARRCPWLTRDRPMVVVWRRVWMRRVQALLDLIWISRELWTLFCGRTGHTQMTNLQIHKFLQNTLLLAHLIPARAFVKDSTVRTLDRPKRPWTCRFL